MGKFFRKGTLQHDTYKVTKIERISFLISVPQSGIPKLVSSIFPLQRGSDQIHFDQQSTNPMSLRQTHLRQIIFRYLRKRNIDPQQRLFAIQTCLSYYTCVLYTHSTTRFPIHALAHEHRSLFRALFFRVYIHRVTIERPYPRLPSAKGRARVKRREEKKPRARRYIHGPLYNGRRCFYGPCCCRAITRTYASFSIQLAFNTRSERGRTLDL